jgi:hypothetical protein
MVEDGGSIFMNSTLVANVKKNALEEIRISLLKNNKLDLRTYFFFPNEKESKPTRKGIWLSFKHIPPIVAAFEKYLNDPNQEFTLKFPQTEKEEIRVYINEFKGAKVVHIRTFYLKDNEFTPGRGISFSTAVLKEMTEGLKQTEKYNEGAAAK